MDNTNRIDEYVKKYPDIIDCINEYVKECPQDIMIFNEVFQRAKLSQEEQMIFGKAVANYASTIVKFHIKNFFDELKDNKNEDNH